MKIAFIGPKGIPAKYGGVEKNAEEVAIRLASFGHEVFVYARNNYTDKKLKEYKGVKIINLPSIATKHLDAISHTFLATMHALFQDYDVIHYHAIGPTSLSFIPKIFKRKTAIIATHHCQDYNHKKWGLIARAYLFFGECITSTIPDKTIVISKILKEYIKNKFKNDPIFIPNGANVFPSQNVDYLKKWNLQKDNYIFLASRLIRHKGVQYLIKAFNNLEDKNLTGGKKLVIAGDGFYTDDYVKEIKDLSIGRKNIIFTGNQSGEALRQLFSHAYIFVHPSESEGLSLSLLEAMGYGKAIVSSDIKENVQVIDSETAFIFESKNVKDLEIKLDYAIKNPSLCRSMGEKAVKKIKIEYNWDNISKEIEGVYIDVLKKKR